MLYSDFQGKKLSRLGFGAMRLPQLGGSINEEETRRMVDLAIKSGVNYFDTAFPYHGGNSELVMGKILADYPRDSFYLATKYPGHQISSSYNPEEVFEKQLKKCGVEYFDFYLLHNVYENSINVYKDEKWGILKYFIRQKELGRIKHLGFSSHGSIDCMREFIEYAKVMEFCQIQLNYLDWTLQDAKAKCEMLNAYGIPIWVMEPVRGGRLASLSDADAQKLSAAGLGQASAALSFVNGIKGVSVILSGMSSYEQMQDNINTFNKGASLSDENREMLLSIAEGMKDSLPCTGCRYCTDNCPMGLDIPTLIAFYNEVRFGAGSNLRMRVECLPEDKQPAACLGCGACAAVCPQKIDIPAAMRDLDAKLKLIPSWVDICRQRELDRLKLEGK